MIPQDYEHFAAGLDGDAGITHAINSVAANERYTRASGQFGTESLPKNTVVLTCGADLTPEPVQWLWPDWLALGKFAPLRRRSGVQCAAAARHQHGRWWQIGRAHV